MKITTQFLTLALVLSTGAAFAQAPGGARPDRPPGGPDGPRMKPPIMTALDADGDHTISAEEITNAPVALKKLLKNGATHLTMEDLRPPRPEGGGDSARSGRGEGPQGGPGSDRPAGRPQEKGDSERRGRPEGTQGGPGGERPQGGPGGERPQGGREAGQRGAPPVVAALDANNDGTISAEEITNAPITLKKLDKDGDGKLTMEEIRPPGGPGGNRERGQGSPQGRGVGSPDGEGARKKRPDAE